MEEQQTGIIFITKDHIEIFSPNSSEILTCVYPQNLVSDFEVRDAQGLSKFLHSFLQQSRIASSLYVFVLSGEVVYERSFDMTQTPDINQQNQFLQAVPFETVVRATFTSGTTVRVFGTNGEFVELLKKVFEANGCSIIAAVPETVFGLTIRQLDNSNVHTLLHDVLSHKQVSFLFAKPPVAQTPTEKRPAPSRDLPVGKNVIAVIVFILLLVVLGVIVYLKAF